MVCRAEDGRELDDERHTGRDHHRLHVQVPWNSIEARLDGQRLALEALTDPYRRAIEHKLDRLRRTDEALLFELTALLIRQTHLSVTFRLVPTRSA